MFNFFSKVFSSLLLVVGIHHNPPKVQPVPQPAPIVQQASVTATTDVVAPTVPVSAATTPPVSTKTAATVSISTKTVAPIPSQNYAPILINLAQDEIKLFNNSIAIINTDEGYVRHTEEARHIFDYWIEPSFKGQKTQYYQAPSVFADRERAKSSTGVVFIART